MNDTNIDDIKVIAAISGAIIMVMIIAMAMIWRKISSESVWRKERALKLLNEAGYTVADTCPATSNNILQAGKPRELVEAIHLILGDAPVLIDINGELVGRIEHVKGKCCCISCNTIYN